MINYFYQLTFIKDDIPTLQKTLENTYVFCILENALEKAALYTVI